MGRTRIVEAMIPVGDGDVATEFCLLKAGANNYADGDTIIWDDEAAQKTLTRYRSRGIDLMADYEHMSLSRPPQPAPASAKKWVPELRGGDLYASQIAWTDKAKSMLEAGEYRYFSIACRVDTKTNRCIELLNFALTNLPAGNGLSALVAASRNFHDEEESMSKTVIVALGLSADADESAAVAKASRLAELERDVLALTKAKSLTEAAGALQAMRQSHEQVVALNARVQQLESEQRGIAFDALVKQGQDGNQLTKAMADGAWLKSLRGRDDGVEQLKSFLASAPKLAAKSADVVEAERPVAEVEITPADRAIAKHLVGSDPVALKKHLDELKAHRLALKEGN
jgi:phage I-like protein